MFVDVLLMSLKAVLIIIVCVVSLFIVGIIWFICTESQNKKYKKIVKDADEGDELSRKELERLVLNKKLNDKKIERLRSRIKQDKIRNYMRLVKRADAGDEEATKELEELVCSKELTEELIEEVRNMVKKKEEERIGREKRFDEEYMELEGATEEEQQKSEGIVRCKVDGVFDMDGTVGRYEDGVVYCVSVQGDYIVGYYELEQTGRIVVYANDKEVIGYVEDNDIILSRQGQCNRFAKMGYPKKPPHMEWCCAERFSNCICEKTEMACIALCEEDHRDAAAAFICMQYDGVGLQESLYHDFWYGWL